MASSKGVHSREPWPASTGNRPWLRALPRSRHRLTPLDRPSALRPQRRSELLLPQDNRGDIGKLFLSLPCVLPSRSQVPGAWPGSVGYTVVTLTPLAPRELSVNILRACTELPKHCYICHLLWSGKDPYPLSTMSNGRASQGHPARWLWDQWNLRH